MGEGDNGGIKGKGQVKEHKQRTHGQGQWEGLTVGGGEWAGQGRAMWEKWGQLKLNNSKKF